MLNNFNKPLKLRNFAGFYKKNKKEEISFMREKIVEKEL